MVIVWIGVASKLYAAFVSLHIFYLTRDRPLRLGKGMVWLLDLGPAQAAEYMEVKD